MANINVTFKGLTGVYGTVTIDDALTLGALITAIAGEEGLPTDYYALSREDNPNVNDTVYDDSTVTIGGTLPTGAGITADTRLICTPRQQGTKERRQIQKLEIAQLKRKGTFRDTATYTNAEDAPYYRSNNTYDATSLPDVYNGNLPGADDNPNTGGLIPKRPWIAVSGIAAPQSIEESVGGDTFTDLEIWYDGSDTATIVPTGIADEDPVNQWNDKSGNQHNLNFVGGNNKPSYESSDLQNTHEYVEFADGDLMSINPITALSGATAFSVFVIAKTTDLSTNDPQVLTSTENSELQIQINSDGTATFQAASGVTITASGANITSGQWNVYTFIYNGNSNPLVGRVNNGTTVEDGGSAVNGPASLDAGSDYFYVGGDNTGGTFIGGVGEVILFRRALNATEYANVENYLTTKWGI